MDPVTGLAALGTVKEVLGAVGGILRSSSSGENKAEEGGSTAEKALNFQEVLGRLLPSDKQEVSEEELFAAILAERIAALKGKEAADKFKEFLETSKSELRRADGFVPVEDAANKALSRMVKEGILTSKERDTVYKSAFRAAQLDDNLEALYDNRGSEGDPTIATAPREKALRTAEELLAKIEEGKINLDNEVKSSSDEKVVTPSGGTVDGSGGFLFKPVSDSNGKLVVLLPAKISSSVVDVILKDENGEKVEEGKFSGIANGDRAHFRFRKPGRDYPKNLTVEIRLKSGRVIKYFIPDPSSRYD